MKLAHYIKDLKWYHLCLFIFLIVRVIDIPYGEEIVPKYAHMAHYDSEGNICGYTYQSMWYYFWMRMIELSAIYTIFRESKQLTVRTIFLGLIILCVGKILDERTGPFKFHFPETITWGIAIVSTSLYIYVQRRNNSPNQNW